MKKNCRTCYYKPDNWNNAPSIGCHWPDPMENVEDLPIWLTVKYYDIHLDINTGEPYMRIYNGSFLGIENCAAWRPKIS